TAAKRKSRSKKKSATKARRSSSRKRAPGEAPGRVGPLKGLAATAEMQPQYRVPRRIFDIKQPTAKVARTRSAAALGARSTDDEARATAEAYIKKIAPTL